MSDPVLIAIIASIPPTLVGILGYLQGRKNRKDSKAEINDIHVSINSRMTELINATKGESKAQGKEEGKLEERKEVAERL